MASLVPRPLPDFILQPWRTDFSWGRWHKIWEWPGDEASHQLCSIAQIIYKSLLLMFTNMSGYIIIWLEYSCSVIWNVKKSWNWTVADPDHYITTEILENVQNLIDPSTRKPSQMCSENYWPVFYKTFTDTHNILNMTLESNSSVPLCTGHNIIIALHRNCWALYFLWSYSMISWLWQLHTSKYIIMIIVETCNELKFWNVESFKHCYMYINFRSALNKNVSGYNTYKNKYLVLLFPWKAYASGVVPL